MGSARDRVVVARVLNKVIYSIALKLVSDPIFKPQFGFFFKPRHDLRHRQLFDRDSSICCRSLQRLNRRNCQLRKEWFEIAIHSLLQTGIVRDPISDLLGI